MPNGPPPGYATGRIRSIRNIWEKLKITIGSNETRKSSGGGNQAKTASSGDRGRSRSDVGVCIKNVEEDDTYLVSIRIYSILWERKSEVDGVRSDILPPTTFFPYTVLCAREMTFSAHITRQGDMLNQGEKRRKKKEKKKLLVDRYLLSFFSLARQYRSLS